MHEIGPQALPYVARVLARNDSKWRGYYLALRSKLPSGVFGKLPHPSRFYRSRLLPWVLSKNPTSDLGFLLVGHLRLRSLGN